MSTVIGISGALRRGSFNTALLREAAELAPADIRGAAMGAFGSAPAIGFAIAPLIGLQARNSFGDETTWALFAVIGVVAAMLGGLALAGLDRRAGPEPSAVLEA